MLEPTIPPAAEPQVPAVSSGLRGLVAAGIVLLGLYFGRPLLVPIILAVLLAFVLAPLVRVLQRARLGSPASVLLAVALAFAVIGGVGVVVVNQAAGLVDQLPQYRANIVGKVHALSMGGEFLDHLAGSVRNLLGGEVMMDGPAPPPGTTLGTALGTAPGTALPAFQPLSTVEFLRAVAEPLLRPAVTAGIVVVFTIFILLYRADLRDRLVRLAGRRDLHRTILALNEAARRLSRYFVAQVLLAVGFGVFVGSGLSAAGLPAPFLWGLLAGAMRFVPFIGTSIALLPPLLLAMAVSSGWGLAGIVLLVIMTGTLVMGQIVEPLTYGRRTGVSPLAVILSTAFWAFMWGPLGLLIATPLTVCLVVFGRHIPMLSFVHVMLGDSSPLDPDETFYQRALEGKRAELVQQARTEIARTSPADYFDAVALGGVALAQKDLTRHELDFTMLEAVHAEIEPMLAGLEAMPAQASGLHGLPEEWTAPGSIVFIPGRGPLDDLAARMGALALRARGFGTLVFANSALGPRSTAIPDTTRVRLCCLAVLDEGSSAASIQFFLRRMERAMPDAVQVVGLWRATAESVTLASLRTVGGNELIVRSIGELLALARALAVRGPEATPGRTLAQPTGPA